MSEIQRWAVQEVRLFDSIFVLQVIVDRSFGFFFFGFLSQFYSFCTRWGFVSLSVKMVARH